MPMPEFLAWVEFFKLYPFDDYSRYYRPAALIGTSMTGADVGELLAWLSGEKPAFQWSEADLATFKAFGVTPPTRPKTADEGM